MRISDCGMIGGFPNLRFRIPQSEIRIFLLRHPVASIDAVGLGHHIIGVTGRKKHCTGCYLLCAAHATNRYGQTNASLFLADRQLLNPRELSINHIPHRSIDDSRGDRIHVDPLLDQCKPGRLSEANNSRFRSTVGRSQRFAPPAGLARQIDDLAAAPLVDHLPNHGLHREKTAVDVHRENPSPLFGSDLGNRRERIDCGTIDQDIDGSRRFDCSFNQVID